MQGRIQGFAKVGGAVPPLLFLFPSPVFLSFLTLSPFPLEVVPLKPASGSGGALVSSPSGVWDGAPAENEFVAL